MYPKTVVLPMTPSATVKLEIGMKTTWQIERSCPNPVPDRVSDENTNNRYKLYMTRYFAFSYVKNNKSSQQYRKCSL